MTGACMSPFTAMLILRGLKTLELRMQRHASNADYIAGWLNKHAFVKQIHYPFDTDNCQFALAKKQMHYGGGMIAFELEGGFQQGLQFMDALQLVQRAVSLGDAESLIQHPASMTHSTYSEEEELGTALAIVSFDYQSDWSTKTISRTICNMHWIR